MNLTYCRWLENAAQGTKKEVTSRILQTKTADSCPESSWICWQAGLQQEMHRQVDENIEETIRSRFELEWAWRT